MFEMSAEEGGLFSLYARPPTHLDASNHIVLTRFEGKLLL